MKGFSDGGDIADVAALKGPFTFCQRLAAIQPPPKTADPSRP